MDSILPTWKSSRDAFCATPQCHLAFELGDDQPITCRMEDISPSDQVPSRTRSPFPRSCCSWGSTHHCLQGALVICSSSEFSEFCLQVTALITGWDGPGAYKIKGRLGTAQGVCIVKVNCWLGSCLRTTLSSRYSRVVK